MKRAVIFRILMVLYVATVAYLCFANFGVIQNVPATILGIRADKVVHFLMFLPFPILAPLCFPDPGKTPVKAVLGMVATFLTGCILAGGTEFIQTLLPYRCGDHNDFFADMLGLAAGCIISIIIVSERQRKSRNEA